MKKSKSGIQLKKLARGKASTKLFLIFLIILFLFLGSFFLKSNNGNNETSNTTQSVNIPSTGGETGGGLKAIDISPFISAINVNDAACKIITNDSILVIDNSSSMDGNKLKEAKAAAKVFVQLIGINPQSRVGLVIFNVNSTIKSSLTNDFASVNSQIDKIPQSAGSCVQCGILAANTDMQAKLRSDVKRSVVLLSDGLANHVNGKTDPQSKAKALIEAKKGNSQNGTGFYTIAFGKDADTGFMRQIATSTGGVSYSTISESEFTRLFTQTATDICK